MVKTRINQMRLDEIFEKIGDNIGKDQLQYIAINREELNIDECDSKNVIEYIKRNENNMDKERLVYCIACNIQEAIKELESENPDELMKVLSERIYKYFENAKELLRDTKVEIADIIMKNGRLEVKNFYTVNNFFGRKSRDNELRQKNDALIKDAQQNNMLDKILSSIFARDLQDCLCYYKGNGDFLKYIVQENYTNLIQASIKRQESLEKSFSKEELYVLNEMAYTQELSNVVKKYSHKIDVEKLMLLSAYRAKDSLENYFNKLSFIQRIDYAEVMKYVSQRLDSKLRMNEEIASLYTAKKVYIQYSTKALLDDVQRIVTAENGSVAYFPKKELVQIRNSVLNGEESLSRVVKIGVFPLLKFSAKERQKLIKQEAYNFELLIDFECLTSEEIKEALAILGEYKIEIVDYLYQEGLIDKTDLVKMYMRNQMYLDKALDCNALYDLKSEVNVEDLMNYYAKIKEDEVNIKDFERYALLFREIKLKGQKPAVQSKLSEQIVEKIYETEGDYKEDFKKLYQLDLLSIRMLIDWNGEDIIYDLIANQQLKPRDAKDLLITQELNLEKAYETLKKSNLSDEEKMNFIFSSFDGTGKNEEEIKAQNEARMYLIQAVCISKDITYGEKSSNGKERRNVTEGMKRNQYVTDPVYRWQLFSQMDLNCTSKAYLDGTVVFTLPNVKNGIVVIEKMYKGTKEGTKINYGSATYVMSEEEFVNYKSQIEQDRKINRKVLIQLMEEGKADKIIHSESWGKGLKKHLGFCVENGYSEEKMAKIDELVARIERARELVR